MTNINDHSRSWLNKRGITNKIIDVFSLSVADGMGLQDAIVIPVNHIDGTLSFNKYRRNPLEGDVKPKYLYERGGTVTLYGADQLVAHNPNNPFMGKSIDEILKDGKRMLAGEVIKDVNGQAIKPVHIRPKPKVMLTEGELDTLVCWSQNIPAVSSTGGAQSFQADWVELLDRYDVYICFDNDNAGHKGVIKVLGFLPEAKVIFVPSTIPGVKDISDYVAHGGDLRALMSTAKQYLSVEDVEAERERIAAEWGNYDFHDLYIETNKVAALPSNTGGPAAPSSKSDDRLERAKSVDCQTLLPFKRQGGYPVTQCKWHNDHDPSLTYYKRNNTCYCHVCGKYADAIDIYMVVNDLSGKEGFKEAIKKLIRE